MKVTSPLRMSTFFVIRSITNIVGRQGSTYKNCNAVEKSVSAFALLPNSKQNTKRLSNSLRYFGTNAGNTLRSGDRTRLFSTASSVVNGNNSTSFAKSPSNKTFATATVAATSAAIFVGNSFLDEKSTATCEESNNADETIHTMPFPENALKHDHYNGVTIDISKLPQNLTESPDLFEEALVKALSIWKIDGKRGIWIKMSKEFSNLIPPSIENGFDFQLAEKGRVILTRWLPTDTASRLPLGPTHQVGIGALLIHPTDPTKMLVVQEKSGPAAASKLWKMPTGLSDPGEDITEAAIREMKEETGLNCIFHKIVCFRQSHGVGSTGKSDLFFICLMGLDPAYYKEGKEIELTPQEEEIAGIDWMDMNSFAKQALWVDSPFYKQMNTAMIEAMEEAQARKNGEDFKSVSNGFIAKKLPLGHRPGSNSLYMSNL